MIFSHKRTILFITREKIQWAEGRVPDGKLFGEVCSLTWSEKKLGVALDDIMDRFPKKIRIVAGEDFSYVTHFSKKDKKNPIISDAQALIPEKLQDGWDSQEESSGDVQVMAIQQELFSILKKSFLGRNLQVEAIESESVSIARMIREGKDKAFIFARNEHKIILGIAQNTEVLATRIFSELPEKDIVKEFVDYVSTPRNISIERAYIQDKTGNLAKIFNDLKIEVHKGNIDPMIGVCLKRDIVGRDKDVLNIPLNLSGELAGKNASKRNYSNLRERILLAMFILVITIGVAFVFYMQKSRQKTIKIQSTVQDAKPMDSSGLKWGR